MKRIEIKATFQLKDELDSQAFIDHIKDVIHAAALRYRDLADSPPSPVAASQLVGLSSQIDSASLSPYRIHAKLQLEEYTSQATIDPIGCYEVDVTSNFLALTIAERQEAMRSGSRTSERLIASSPLLREHNGPYRVEVIRSMVPPELLQE